MATPQREEWRKEEDIDIELMLNNKNFKATALPANEREVLTLGRSTGSSTTRLGMYNARIGELWYQHTVVDENLCTQAVQAHRQAILLHKRASN